MICYIYYLCVHRNNDNKIYNAHLSAFFFSIACVLTGTTTTMRDMTPLSTYVHKVSFIFT